MMMTHIINESLLITRISFVSSKFKPAILVHDDVDLFVILNFGSLSSL